MLVLTRKADETIRIGDDIVITVLRTKGKAVRLGIEAPNDKRVLRGEIAFDGEDMADQTSDAEESAVVQTRISRKDIATLIPQLVNTEAPLAGFVSATH
ncbi:carbon storage regulator [Aeoliella mucimassa]|uniref:Translational regulator CsrA n=1 Tax=Aeoliella mucimassa TaxID=2527972 RepID=A0A518AM51_9BACT|nr:carbon storage regulator [Aeoliella mucimassa]QDU55805.1 Carbon storage regulator [Aeoliella mucimassa]